MTRKRRANRARTKAAYRSTSRASTGARATSAARPRSPNRGVAVHLTHLVGRVGRSARNLSSSSFLIATSVNARSSGFRRFSRDSTSALLPAPCRSAVDTPSNAISRHFSIVVACTPKRRANWSTLALPASTPTPHPSVHALRAPRPTAARAAARVLRLATLTSGPERTSNGTLTRHRRRLLSLTSPHLPHLPSSPEGISYRNCVNRATGDKVDGETASTHADQHRRRRHTGRVTRGLRMPPDLSRLWTACAAHNRFVKRVACTCCMPCSRCPPRRQCGRRRQPTAPHPKPTS